IAPEAFQMQQPQEAQTVSEFQPGEIIPHSEKPLENPLAILSQMREEHRKELQLMFENDYYATVSPGAGQVPEKGSDQAVPPKPPATFSLKELWKQPLTGPGNITTVTTDSGTRLLIPCEGNSLAIFDLSGKLLQKFKPEGLLNDELLTLIRTGTDGTGKRYIGISSIGGCAVHVFDNSLKPIFSYSPGTGENSKCGVADFRFIDLHGHGSLSMIVGVIALDEGKDSVRAIDLQGKEIWRDDSVSSPFQVDSFVLGDKREILCLDVQEQRSLLSIYDLQGKRLASPTNEEGRQIIWFHVSEIDGDGQSEIAILHADKAEKEVQIAAWDRSGRLLWNQPLPTGEYHKPIEQIITGNIQGDAIKEWIVPSPNGMVFVFDRNGNALDTFSFGKFLTGLAVVHDEDRRILITADTESVTAFLIATNN
ncbi:MAG: hypothetical protein LBQ50_01100, partial [Planctomycetaceae bacterium]|nr:hypothetical protein [Planctomycetaceae bacterium]